MSGTSAPDWGADWTVGSGRPIDGGYALVAYAGWGQGPASDPYDIRDPLMLLVNHSWLSAKVRAMDLELSQL